MVPLLHLPTLVAAIVLSCLLLPPLRPAAAAPWSNSAARDISALAVNLSLSFMTNQTCTVKDWQAVDQLEARLRTESVRIIDSYTPRIDANERTLRIQQDPAGSTPQDYYYRQRYSQQGFSGSITIIPTLPYHNHTTITRETYTRVSMAADVRWADVSGLGTEAVPVPDRTVLFHPFFMYYRRDILAAHNMSVPTTWDGLLAAARYINGSDLDGDGRPEYALCFNSNYHCQQSYMLLAIFASMVQVHPKDSAHYTGAWFNATGPTLRPLVNNTAMQRALQIYAQLAAYNHPVAPDACDPHSEAFSGGKCVFAFNMDQFRLNARQPTPYSPRFVTYGRLGTALCPGSPVVLDPASNTLVPCTAATCPLSHAPPDAPPPAPAATAPRINRAPLDLAIRTQLIINNDTAVDVIAFRYNYFQYSLMDWSSTYVGPLLTSVYLRMSPDEPPPAAATPPPDPPPAAASTPPRSAGPHTATSAAPPKGAAPRPQPPGLHQGYSAAAMPDPPRAAAAAPGGRRRLQAAAAAAEGVGTYKGMVGVGLNGWAYNATVLTEHGWHPDDALSFIWALQHIWAHPNRVMDIFIPGSSYYRLALADAATNATRPGADTAAIAATLAEQYAYVASLFGDPDVSRRIYRSCMNMTYVDNATTAAAASAPSGGGGGSDWRPAYTAAVVAVTLVAVAAMLLAGLVLRARSKGRTLLGAVIAPGLGASTTLLVTDIQNSTVMWEQLPETLMEEVLRIHHAVLRSLLDRHRGYESATEGDSFILAFHSPAEALTYAIEAQAALLEADWPPALLGIYREAGVIHSAAVKGNPEAELSYVVRRLQQGQHPAGETTLSLASHMATLRIVRAATNTAPPSRISRFCAPLLAPILATATRAAAAIANSARALARMLAPALARRAAQRQQDLRTAALGGSLALDGEGGEEGGPAETLTSSLTGAATSRAFSCTFGWALSQAWMQLGKEDVPPKLGVLSPSTALTWRGVRVRMGIHSGLADPLQLQYNRASRRVQYSGAFADTAKAVADAAHGGQVLLSDAAFAQLSGEYKAAAQLLILMLGDFNVTAADPPAALPLYEAVHPVLAPRLRCFPPLRVPRAPGTGVLDAPIGIVTIVFMKASGVATLTAWNAELTQSALALYHATVSALVPQYSGYVVEMSDELALLAFQRPEAAIGWALAAQAALLEADWPRELLKHDLCEPITTTLVAAAADSHQVVVRHAVHSRGLRLKVGVAMGAAVDSVSEATGRMAYRGKVMNRAARITSAASAGQVLTHAEAWQAAARSVLVLEAGITSTSTGVHTLKGIRHPTELFSCTYISQGLMGAEASPGQDHLLPLQSSLPLRPGVTVLDPSETTTNSRDHHLHLHSSGALQLDTPSLDPTTTTDSSVLLLAACHSGTPNALPLSSSRSASPPSAASPAAAALPPSAAASDISGACDSRLPDEAPTGAPGPAVAVADEGV